MGYYFLLLLLLGFGVWYFQQWSQQVGPEKTRQALKKIGIGALVVLGVALAIRSGSVLVGLLPVLAVAFNRILTLLTVLSRWTPFTHWLAAHLAQRSTQRSTQAGAGYTAGSGTSHSASSITTKYFSMTLNQASGEFDGKVIAGQQEGAVLSQLDLNALLELYREISDDPQSQAVLEAFLDFRFGDQWRQATGTAHGASDNPSDINLNNTMTPAQAYAVLGLQPGASEQDIRQAHRRLSQRLHPDQGGNDALCSLINQARDVLLK